MAKKKKEHGFWADFKAFITRGNVVDLAVAVVIGGAFGSIVTGFVNYIINPFIAVFTKDQGLDGLKTVLVKAVYDGETLVKPEVAILWGTWIQTIINFIIIAFCIFLMIRLITSVQNKLKAKEIAEKAAADAEAAEKAAAEKAEADRIAAEKAEADEKLKASIANQEVLLKEILNELKKK